MNGRPVPVTNAEQSQKTRRALLDTARATFTVQGYAAASTGEIVCRAGVTRGALYYHFRDKAALFEAVFDEVRGEHIQALRTAMAAAEGEDWQRLMTWVGLTLERILDPSVRRIVYIDGPAVLNWSSEQRRAPAIACVAGTPAGSAPHERGGGCASAGSAHIYERASRRKPGFIQQDKHGCVGLRLRLS